MGITCNIKATASVPKIYFFRKLIRHWTSLLCVLSIDLSGWLFFYQSVCSAGVVLFYHKWRQLIFTSSRTMNLWDPKQFSNSPHLISQYNTQPVWCRCKKYNLLHYAIKGESKAVKLKTEPHTWNPKSQIFYLVKIGKSNKMLPIKI